MKPSRNANVGILLCLLSAAALFTCEKVPDYCGKGERCDPDYQFCFGNKTYNKCGGSTYNPLTSGCDTVGNTVGTKCYDGSVVKSGSPCGGYTLTTAEIPAIGGTVTRNPNSTTYAAGSDMVLNATAADKYTFIGWEGTETSKNPIQKVTMNRNKTLVAIFKPTDPGDGRHTLVTAVFPENSGTLDRIPNGGPDPEIGTYSPTTKTVNVTANANKGYTFEKWLVASTGVSLSVDINLDESKTLVAMFKPSLCTLTVNTNPVDGGAVFVNNTATAGIMPALSFGSKIDVRAVTAPGYEFSGWAGADTSKSAALTLTMNGSKTLTAKFKKVVASGGTAIDTRDGKKYRTMKIGRQTWMAENMNHEMGNSWCYENSPDSCKKYGRLYTWNAAMDACPTGWRLPNFEDLKQLTEAMGGFEAAYNKAKAKNGWISYKDPDYPNIVMGNGTDDYGFSALPGGARDLGGDYINSGYGGYWWTSEHDDYNSDKAYFMAIAHRIFSEYYHKLFGFSVRCIEGGSNASPPPPPAFKPNKCGVNGTADSCRTTEIGGMTWMAENLNRTVDNSWCTASNDGGCATYGRWYTWNAAKTACPTGWHLPDTAEWRWLVTAAGGAAAGKALKSTRGWDDKYSDRDGNGTDKYGFSALPGGYSELDGNSTYRSDGGGGGGGYWWTNSESGNSGDTAYYVNMSSYDLVRIGENINSEINKKSGLNVRCLKDGGVTPPPPPPTYPVNVLSAGTGATVSGSYAAGDRVTITAGTPPAGQKFKTWTTASNGVNLYDPGSATTFFVMPANAVTVTAVFEQADGSGGGGYVDPSTVVKGTFTDSRDSKTYKTVKIGDATWMAENLKYQPPTGNAWCYDDNPSMCNTYGRLYDWDAAMTVCPSGWRLSSRKDWDILGEAVGGVRMYNEEYGVTDWIGAGKKLKSKSGWNIQNDGSGGNGTDEYGFSALPGGFWASDGSDFSSGGNGGYWWASMEINYDWAYTRLTRNWSTTDDIEENGDQKSFGYSVRCVKDD